MSDGPSPPPLRPVESPAGPGTDHQTAEALERLRRQFEKLVRRVSPPWLAAHQDDLVQLAMLRVTQVMERGEGNATLSSSYLWRVAYSVTVDEIRRLARRKETDLDQAGAPAMPDPRPVDPETLVASRQLGAAIRDCLRRLGEDRRVAVTLHLLGHSVPEIGQRLGWATKRAENLVYRGVGDLRRCLVEKGHQP